MSWMEVLPAIGTFLGGPAGGLVGSGIEWLAGRFGASDKTVEGIKQTLAGMTPADLNAAKKIDIEFQEFCLDHDIKLNLAQLAVDQEEAKSTNWFVAGWRPYVGWVCGTGLAYVSLVEPIMRFVGTVMIHYTGPYPVIDTTLTAQILLGMLGMSYFRTQEKNKGTESNR